MLKRNVKTAEQRSKPLSRGATRFSSVKQEQKSRSSVPWSKIMLFAGCTAFLFAVLWGWPVLMNWVNQPIARVEVRSPFKQVEEIEVQEKLSPWLSNRFFFLDLGEMKARVLSIPWVDEASLRREWPDRLVVLLREREPVARWQNGLIDVDGNVFRPESVGEFESLPLLSGPEDRSQDVMQQYLAISQLLRPLGVSVRELKLSSTDSWWFKVDHVAVNIGRDRRMERLQRFIRLYHAKLNERWQDVERVDLRYLNGASVAWK